MGEISISFRQELIAPCGMNCGICSAYLRDKRRCLGCRSRDKKCGIRNCEKFQKNRFKYCYECDGFPCIRIKRLDKRYRTRYKMSMVENLEYIRDNGVDRFLKREATRWKCPECGGIICVHNGICYSCGTQKGIPKTGKIGRFARILEKATNQDVLKKVMQDSDKYESYNNAKKAAWWKKAIERLEKVAGREKAIEIMETYGQKCCGETYRKIAKQYWSESKNLKEFIDKLNSYIYRGQVFGIGGGRLKIEDRHTIIGGYDHCYCGQVKHTKEPFSSDIYCRCGAAWLKVFFESALEKPVDVEMIQTIVGGEDSCEFVIHI